MLKLGRKLSANIFFIVRQMAHLTKAFSFVYVVLSVSRIKLFVQKEGEKANSKEKIFFVLNFFF